MSKIAVIAGTRPEAIKLAPVIKALANSGSLSPLAINTGQHRELCGQAFSHFGIKPDIRLDTMISGQSLPALQARLLGAIDHVLAEENPAGIIVQGDTMSAFCGALAGFYRHIPVFHVEAGLRSHDLGEPFPEEALRQMLARVASLHFAPTPRARDALLAENIPAANIFVTGNTVVDALFSLTPEALEKARLELASKIPSDRPFVLVTAHRRENHGQRLARILDAIAELAQKFVEYCFIIPVHPSPTVRQAVFARLCGYDNIRLLEPLDYPQLVSILKKSTLVLSDSGGIQEEAPSFGAPVLVLRYETERQEGLEAGCATLVGADTGKIAQEAARILSAGPGSSRPVANPYGDGRASARIINQLKAYFGKDK